jgi:hypothetical protein
MEQQVTGRLGRKSEEVCRKNPDIRCSNPRAREQITVKAERQEKEQTCSILFDYEVMSAFFPDLERDGITKSV